MIKEVPYYKTRPYHQDGKRYGLMFKENTNYWGYYKSKKLLGFVGYDLLQNNKAILRSDYVIEEARGQGIYKMLNDFRHNLLIEKGVKEMTITCTENSKPLHEKLGAVVTKEFKKYTKMKYKL